MVDVGGGIKIGGGNFQVIAGPCSVESEEQIIEVAKAVKASGATLLRGGAFKPRTSPYAFQGLRAEGIEAAAGSEKRNRHADRYGNHECISFAAFRECGYHSGRGTKYAELRTAESAWKTEKAGSAEARTGKYNR